MTPLAIYAICLPWLLVAISRPRRPRADNEAAWLVYSRLYGGWDRLRVAALCLTYGAAFVLFLVAIQRSA